jgi:hypothetical protein
MSRIALQMAMTLALVLLPTVSHATKMDDKLKQCRKEKGCGYSVADNGDVTGCSIKSNGGTGKCFFCNASTKQCVEARRVPSDKLQAIRNNVAAGVKTSAQGERTGRRGLMDGNNLLGNQGMGSNSPAATGAPAASPATSGGAGRLY